MKILVTGASGFIGSKLVPQLFSQGHTVITFGRKPTKFTNAKHIIGDIVDAEAVNQAVCDCDIVFHLAGLVSYDKKDTNQQYKINVTGTENVMKSALSNGVKRVIHTSSIAAMGIPDPGTIGDESIAYNLSGLGLNYCDSKYAAEEVALSYAKKGLPVVVLNPGIILGEGDTHKHHKVIFLAMAKGWLVGCPKGGVTFCDIEDIIQAHINSIQLGRSGQRYVVGGSNLTYKEAAGNFAKVFGAREPKFDLPESMIYAIAGLCETVFPMLGKSPSLTKQSAWLSQQNIFFSSEKAIKELGFKTRPFEDTICRIAPYYLGNHDLN